MTGARALASFASLVLPAVTAGVLACRPTQQEAPPATTAPPAPTSAATAAASNERPRERSERPVRVLLVTSGNFFLRAALLDGPFEVVTASPESYPVAGPFEVTVFDAVAPAVAADAGSLVYLGATGKHAPLPTHGVEQAGDPPFGFDRIVDDNPLLTLTHLDAVNIASAVRTTPSAGDLVLGATETGMPLLVIGSRDNHHFTALTFDLRHSDLPMRVDWPVVLVRAIGAPLLRDLFAIPLRPSAPPAPLPAAVEATGPSHARIIDTASERGFSSVAYGAMYAKYLEVARERLAEPEFPAPVRHYVERYFESIAPAR
jgi:hypothetical protein